MTRRHVMQDLQAKMLTFTVLVLVWEVIARTKHRPELYPTVEYLFSVSLPSLGMFSQSPTAGLGPALSTITRNGLITLGRVGAGLAVGVPLGISGGLLLHYLRGSG